MATIRSTEVPGYQANPTLNREQVRDQFNKRFQSTMGRAATDADFEGQSRQQGYTGQPISQKQLENYFQTATSKYTGRTPVGNDTPIQRIAPKESPSSGGNWWERRSDQPLQPGNWWLGDKPIQSHLTQGIPEPSSTPPMVPSGANPYGPPPSSSTNVQGGDEQSGGDAVNSLLGLFSSFPSGGSGGGGTLSLPTTQSSQPRKNQEAQKAGSSAMNGLTLALNAGKNY